jgi:hypothetical protein
LTLGRIGIVLKTRRGEANTVGVQHLPRPLTGPVATMRASQDRLREQDSDPRTNTDCATASPQANNVRAAEFQAFAQ